MVNVIKWEILKRNVTTPTNDAKDRNPSTPKFFLQYFDSPRPFRGGQQHRQELWQQKAQKNASPSLVTLIADETSTLDEQSPIKTKWSEAEYPGQSLTKLNQNENVVRQTDKRLQPHKTNNSLL